MSQVSLWHQACADCWCASVWRTHLGTTTVPRLGSHMQRALHPSFPFPQKGQVCRFTSQTREWFESPAGVCITTYTMVRFLTAQIMQHIGNIAAFCCRQFVPPSPAVQHEISPSWEIACMCMHVCSSASPTFVECSINPAATPTDLHKQPSLPTHRLRSAGGAARRASASCGRS